MRNRCLLYLVYGKETYNQEAFFSIMSALSFFKDDSDIPRIRVVAENPEFYAQLPVETTRLDVTTREAWSGPANYHFRMKHALLLKELEAVETAILVDTDTFFHQSPAALFERVQPGFLLCHMIGNAFGQDKSALRYQLFADYLKKEGGDFDDALSTNSGVIGLTVKNKDVLEYSLRLMDRLMDMGGEQLFTLEEFCLSLAAHRRVVLRSCEDVIFHYWSRKVYFRAKAQAWIAKHGTNPMSAAALADVQKVTGDLPRTGLWIRGKTKLFLPFFPQNMRQFAKEILNGCGKCSNEFDQAALPCWWDKAIENALERGKAKDRAEISKWLEAPLLRWLAGKDYEKMCHYVEAHCLK